jgi:HTH-type transcriptional regulator / antitoxin HipB
MARNSSRSAGSPATWATSLAQTVRTQRKRLRLTQKQLADLSGCGPDFLYDLERGKPTVRLDKLIPVLDALGLELTVAAKVAGAIR